MKRVILISFVLVSLGELIAHVLDISLLQQICKPLIMLTLGAYYSISVEREFRSLLVLLAILFSCAGDVLLMLQSLSADFFTPGLVAFLIAHVFYMFAYRQHRHDETAHELLGTQKVRLAFPIILSGTGLVVVLYPTLGVLKIPVMIYALVLVLMVLTALFRYGRTPSASFWMVFVGALLFMISDSVLAINKFLEPLAHANVLVMSTYIAAQFLLVEGLCRHVKN